MKIFGLGMPEIVVVLVVALLLIGPKTLPKLGGALGKTFKGLREGIEGKFDDETVADDAAKSEVEVAEIKSPPPVEKA